MTPDKLIGLLSASGQALQPLAIRKYQPYLKRPGVVSFAGGWPSPKMFPIETVAPIADRVLKEEGDRALQYNSTIGHDRFRAILAQRMETVYGAKTDPDRVSIISGGQQGLFLSAFVLLNRGDGVAVEAPTFSGGISVYQALGADILELPMDADGVIVEALAAELDSGRSIKLLYTIPDFQNPSGRRLSEPRCKALIELAYKHDFFIVEDAPYAELNYEGAPIPPLYALDTQRERVVFVGSFSKIFAPIRMGWMVAPAELQQKMVIAKQSIDLCSPALTQSILYHFIDQGELEPHIERLNQYYGHKRDVMLAGLDRHLPAEVAWTSPQGGMFVWVTLPEHVDTDQFFFNALDSKVAFVPGSAFFAEDRPTSSFRLNFVSADAEAIQGGMVRLGEAIKEVLS